MDNSKIKENISLRQYTSMYVGGPARYFTEVSTLDDLRVSINFAKDNLLPIFVLGGGSNILVSDKGFPGLVIKISIKGVEKIFEDEGSVRYKVGAGENWDNFVKFCVENNLFGIENLSHIPGTVGASVVQNIGAYGQEVSTSVVSVVVVDRENLTESVLSNNDLNFSYRKSILNNELQAKNKYIVTSVIFELKKKSDLNLGHADIKKYFETSGELPSLSSVRKAIIKCRDSKFTLPDSPKHGTVGSFWNAEVIDENTYESIILRLEEKGFHAKAEEMKNKKSVFTVAQGFKVPYGVLVEVLGYKGKIFSKAKILETHSCVINNFTGESTAKEILDISNTVLENVYKEFGVKMRVEPELVGDFR